MARRWTNDLGWSDVTPKAAYLNRRQIMAGAGALAAGSIAGPALASLGAVESAFSTDEGPNRLEEITGYCNYYEFGTGKEDPARNAHTLTTAPWSVMIDGLVDEPRQWSFEEIMEGHLLLLLLLLLLRRPFSSRP